MQTSDIMFFLEEIRLPDIQGRSSDFLSKLVVSLILQKHFVIHECFPLSLKIIEQL